MHNDVHYTFLQLAFKQLIQQVGLESLAFVVLTQLANCTTLESSFSAGFSLIVRYMFLYQYVTYNNIIEMRTRVVISNGFCKAY